jgi:hypothetical protein
MGMMAGFSMRAIIIAILRAIVLTVIKGIITLT